MSKTRANQGGSVVSFVVIGIILVALVVGGAYVLQHRNGTRSPEVAKTTTPSSQSVSPSPNGSPAPSSSTSPVPSQSVQPAPSASPTPSSQPAPANMPATGPSDLLPSGIIAAILLGFAVAYVQSRQARGRLFDHQ